MGLVQAVFIKFYWFTLNKLSCQTIYLSLVSPKTSAFTTHTLKKASVKCSHNATWTRHNTQCNAVFDIVNPHWVDLRLSFCQCHGISKHSEHKISRDFTVGSLPFSHLS